MANFDSFIGSPMGAFTESLLKARNLGLLGFTVDTTGEGIGSPAEAHGYLPEAFFALASAPEFLTPPNFTNCPAGFAYKDRFFRHGQNRHIFPPINIIMQQYRADTWTTKTGYSPIDEFDYLGVGLEEYGYIYGFNIEDEPTDNTHFSRYHVPNESWSSIPSLALGGTGQAANLPIPSTLPGYVFVFGGLNFLGFSAINRRLDVNSLSWVARTSIPLARRRSGAASIGGYLYVYYGEDSASSESDDRNYRYDNGLDSWITATDYPHETVGFARSDAPVLSDKAYTTSRSIDDDLNAGPLMQFSFDGNVWTTLATPTETWSVCGVIEG